MAEPSYEELKARVAELEKQAGGRRSGELEFKVGEKGGVSVYGLGRFPVTLYYEQWIRLFDAGEKLRAFLAALVFGVFAWGIDTWAVHTRERHLTRGQWSGLAQIRDDLPKNCGMLVYIPVESAEAQNYGKEIQAALQSHGGKANLVYAGAMEPPVGLVVGVLSELNPCGQAGEAVAGQMTDTLHMPARIQEGFPNDSDTVIIILVGTKPPYD